MRLRGVTLLEVLVSLALVALLFALLVPVLRMSTMSLGASDRQSATTEQIEFRTVLRSAFQNIHADDGAGYDMRGTSASFLFYYHDPIQALPSAEVSIFSVSFRPGVAEVSRVVLNTDQTVLYEEITEYALGFDVTASFLPPCQGPESWQADWQGGVPLAMQITANDSEFWPDYLVSRPLTMADGC